MLKTFHFSEGLWHVHNVAFDIKHRFEEVIIDQDVIVGLESGFLDVIKDARIQCRRESIYSDLAYQGYNINII